MDKKSRKREATRLRVQRFRAVRRKLDDATHEPIFNHEASGSSDDGASLCLIDATYSFQNESCSKLTTYTDSDRNEEDREQLLVQLNAATDASLESGDFGQIRETRPDKKNDCSLQSELTDRSCGSDSDSEGVQRSIISANIAHNESQSNEKQEATEEIVQLRQWAIKSNIPQTQLDELLKILRKRLLPDLPTSSKTFLKTTSAPYKIEKFMREGTEIGEFVYFGITQHLQRCVNADLHEKSLKLQFNIDGLPLFKSSSKQFWPILCKVSYQPDVYIPFPVAVYAGNEKPNNINQYLEKFISEINLLQLNGINIDGKKLEVKIDCFICDTPARSFVKCVKGHGGYYACERCTVRGERVQNRTIYNSTNSEERTAASFHAQKNLEHHKGISPLTHIKSGLDMVLSFLLDFMHLVCLGVMKKMFVDCWLMRHEFTRLSSTNKTRLSELLLSFQSQVPEDFQRTTRSISEIAKWKATEYRFFLLYCGPIVLRKILPKNLYQHFLLLHVASRILCSNDLACRYNSQAKAYLRSFVGLTQYYYGKVNLVLNVHNLIHLADDAKNMQRSLSEVTAFPFESTLGKLKKMIRSGNRPLAQLCRRLCETFFANIKKPTLPPSIEIVKHRLADSMGVIGIKKLKYKQAVLSTNAPNNTVLLKNGKIMKISSMVMGADQRLDEIQLTGNILKIDKPIFTYPCDSATLKMWVVSMRQNSLVKYPLNLVESKMVTLACDNKLYAMPLLHG